MLLDLPQLINNYNMKIKGIIHIGAHIGDEYPVYKSCGLNNFIFIEPITSTYQKLLENIGQEEGVTCIKTALGNYTGTVTINTETVNQGQSSSVLKPKKHLEQYPSITFDGTEEVPITTLDKLLQKGIPKKDLCNLINIDIQGYELEAFKGAKKTLEQIDYIMTEVNREELYENCCLVEDLDSYLKNYGFSRVKTFWGGGTWGDAFYAKNKND